MENASRSKKRKDEPSEDVSLLVFGLPYRPSMDGNTVHDLLTRSSARTASSDLGDNGGSHPKYEDWGKSGSETWIWNFR